MTNITIKSTNKSFGGEQRYYTHTSSVIGLPMTFSVYLPPQYLAGNACPAVMYLSGLTCSADNVTHKGFFQETAAKLGMIVIAPDTSPRSTEDVDVPNDDAYDLGQGAGFYVDATQAPWAEHFKMQSYIVDELYDLVMAEFKPSSIGLFGHSMGGHGALTLGFKFPEKFASISAFAPINNPIQVPWGQKCFMAYLGEDQESWKPHDACELIAQKGKQFEHILVDQGSDDEFLAQLLPDNLQAACEKAGQPLTLRMQQGYDHSYYFISTFMAEHLQFHFEAAKK